MDGKYEILHGGKLVGKMTVCREGLYYVFSGKCKLDGEMVYRMQVCCNGFRENLGVLVPRDGTFRDGTFCVEKKIPIKRLGEGIPQFRILPKEAGTEGKFIPIYPEEPFAYMTRLKDAFLALRDGQVGIVLKE